MLLRNEKMVRGEKMKDESLDELLALPSGEHSCKRWNSICSRSCKITSGFDHVSWLTVIQSRLAHLAISTRGESRFRASVHFEDRGEVGVELTI